MVLKFVFSKVLYGRRYTINRPDYVNKVSSGLKRSLIQGSLEFARCEYTSRSIRIRSIWNTCAKMDFQTHLSLEYLRRWTQWTCKTKLIVLYWRRLALNTHDFTNSIRQKYLCQRFDCLQFQKSLKTPRLKSMLVTDVRDGICWWQVYGVTDTVLITNLISSVPAISIS